MWYCLAIKQLQSQQQLWNPQKNQQQPKNQQQKRQPPKKRQQQPRNQQQPGNQQQPPGNQQQLKWQHLAITTTAKVCYFLITFLIASKQLNFKNFIFK